MEQNLWTSTEEKVLVEEYSKARNILQSKLNNKVTVNHKKVLWGNIAAAVSAQGDSSKDGAQCKKKFEDLCMKTKKAVRDIRYPATGGGPPPKMSTAVKMIMNMNVKKGWCSIKKRK